MKERRQKSKIKYERRTFLKIAGLTTLAALAALKEKKFFEVEARTEPLIHIELDNLLGREVRVVNNSIHEVEMQDGLFFRHEQAIIQTTDGSGEGFVFSDIYLRWNNEQRYYGSTSQPKVYTTHSGKFYQGYASRPEALNSKGIFKYFPGEGAGFFAIEEPGFFENFHTSSRSS